MVVEVVVVVLVVVVVPIAIRMFIGCECSQKVPVSDDKCG